MIFDPKRALSLETEFLSGVESNFESAKGKDLRGSSWQWSRHDEGDRLRAMLAERRSYDRDRLRELPSNRRIALHGFERRWWFWRRRTGVAIASTLSPLTYFADRSEGTPPPVDLGALSEHVRQLVGESRLPHLIGVCSLSGFTEEARSARLPSGNATVVLVEPDAWGGWRTTSAGENVDPRVLRMFDPEAPQQKLERVGKLIEGHRAELLTGGVSATSVSRRAGLAVEAVREAFGWLASTDPELRLIDRDGDRVLFRGAPVPGREKKGMNVIERIRRLFSGEGESDQKINLLAERRALLAQRRDRIYEDIGNLEQREADLMKEGRAATSAVPRRRLAAQIAQLRKDITRQNATAAMLNQQINIISTDIHNLTLIEQGKLAELPDTEELTEHAVQAEEMLETLKADNDLVGSLEMGTGSSLAGDDELAILQEFDESSPVSTPPSGVEVAGSGREKTVPARTEPEGVSFDPPEPPPPPEPPSRRRTGPEPT